ncbi:MAG: glycogen debranching N-terminal domain-containing protein, partial [Actinomycetota bacterium]
EARLSFLLGADFEDVFVVRGFAGRTGRGEVVEEVREGALRYLYRRGGFSRGTEVRVAAEGAEPSLERGRVVLDLRLGAGERRVVRVWVSLEEGGEKVRSAERRGELYAGAPVLETDRAALRRSWERSVEDLEALTFDAGEGLLVPAAGAPWYMALFGRDALVTAYGAMILSPEPARNVLRALSRWQAAGRDDYTDAEPGKIPHELRRGELAFFGEVPQTPYYGTADATPLFLVLLEELWRWTADDAFVREMEAPARRCLDWILFHADRTADSFIAYESRSPAGLRNHGWKDSDGSMLFRDGRRAEGRIAPCEVQGYAYDALLRTARLAERVWGDAALAERLRGEAGSLRERFDRAYWMEERGYYALALDWEGRRVDSATSNAGHLLWSGIVPEEKARSVARRLLSEEMFSGWGIRTMAAGEGGYDPLSYHNGSVWPHDNALIACGLMRYGFREEAARVAAALVEAAERFEYRLPEVFGGHRRKPGEAPVEYPSSCSPQAWAAAAVPLLVRAVLGVEPDPETRVLRSAPELPAGVAGSRIEGVPAFGRRHTAGT